MALKTEGVPGKVGWQCCLLPTEVAELLAKRSDDILN